MSEVRCPHLSREALVIDLVFRAGPIACSKEQPQLTESVAIKEGTPRHVDHGPGRGQKRDVATSVVQGAPELWERWKLSQRRREVLFPPISTPFPASDNH